MVLWGIAHGSSTIERNVDIPVAFDGLPDDLVITEQSASEINIRVQGSRAALRNVSPTTMEYPVAIAGARSPARRSTTSRPPTSTCRAA